MPAVAMVGLKPVMVGAPAGAVTVTTALLVAEPAGAVTAIGPVLAPVGTVVMIWLAEDEVTWAATPLKDGP